MSQSLLGFFFSPPPPTPLPPVLHSGWGLSQGRRLEGEESSVCLAQLGLCAVEGGRVSSRPPLRPRRAVQSSQKPPLRRAGEGTLPDFPEAHTCAPHGAAQGFTTAGKEGNSRHTWRPWPWAETDSPLGRLAIWPDRRHPAGPGLGREESLRAGLWTHVQRDLWGLCSVSSLSLPALVFDLGEAVEAIGSAPHFIV